MFDILFIAAMMLGSATEAPVATGPTCHANGLVFGQGEVACLDIPCAPQLARCGMVLNNSAWIKIQDGCVVSSQLGSTLRAHANPQGHLRPVPNEH
ncbi:hypothetical protein PZ895_09505 [Mesorhizobium sp. YIM 152430]|uniref:hypothetical protein n=1 Tax=Mesorhizobium sp. YIM 152430 TaxID=3031761 RepID=UPI0023DAA3E1|nr:hypothetical protein [Mesorhizobium sp. YIM 152430]MDF1600013.1 hypothetical protein [Mesorhizobium sp. YIM 152430]